MVTKVIHNHSKHQDNILIQEINTAIILMLEIIIVQQQIKGKDKGLSLIQVTKIVILKTCPKDLTKAKNKHKELTKFLIPVHFVSAVGSMAIFSGDVQ